MDEYGSQADQAAEVEAPNILLKAEYPSNTLIREWYI
jgi:hypothetical protein